MYPTSNTTQPYIPLQAGVTSQCYPTLNEVNRRANNASQKNLMGSSLGSNVDMLIYPYGTDPLTSETTMGNLMMTYKNGPNISYGNQVLAFPTLNGLFYNDALPDGGLDLSIVGIAKTNHHAIKIGDQSGCAIILHGTTVIHWNPITAHQRTAKDGRNTYKTPPPPMFYPGDIICARFPHPQEIIYRKERGERRIIPDLVKFSWGTRHNILESWAHLNNYVLSEKKVRRHSSIYQQIKTLDPAYSFQEGTEKRELKINGGMNQVVAESLKLCSITSFLHGVEVLMRRGILTYNHSHDVNLTEKSLSSLDLSANKDLENRQLEQFRNFLQTVNFDDTTNNKLTQRQKENAAQLQKDIYSALTWPHLYGSDNITYKPKLFQSTNDPETKAQEKKYIQSIKQGSNYFYEHHKESQMAESEKVIGIVLEPVNPNNSSTTRVPTFVQKSLIFA